MYFTRLFILFIASVLFTFANANDLYLTKNEENFIRNHNTLKIGMLKDFKPFSFIEDEKHQGFTVELLQEVSTITNLKFEVVHGTWTELLNKLKNKELDLISDISYVKKRESFVSFTNDYYKVPIYIFTLKENTSFKNIHDLTGQTVAITKGIFFKDELIKRGINVIEVNNTKEQTKALVFKNAQYFLSSYTNAKKAIKQQELNSIKAVHEMDEVIKEDLRFGINTNHTTLRDIIQKALFSIPKSKKEELKNKWIKSLTQIKKNSLGLSNLEEIFLKTKKSLNYCVQPSWFPFSKIDEKNKHIGISSDYIKLFEKSLNIPLNLVKTNSWEQSLEFIKTGKCDFIPMTMKTKKKEEFLNFSKPYIKTPLVLASKINKPFVENFSNLDNLQIAIAKDCTFSKILKDKYPNLKLNELENIDEGLKEISNDKHYGFVGSLPSIAHKIQDNYIGDLKIAAKFDEELVLSIASSKSEAILNDIFNKVLENINENKKNEILNSYLSLRYEENFNYTLAYQILIAIGIIFIFLIYRHILQYQTNKKLKESYNKIQTILDTTMEGIVISKNQEIIDINKECLNLFKIKNKSSLIGENIKSFIKDSSEQIEQKSKNQPYELELIKSDKTTFPALISERNIKTNDEELRISTIIDLSEIKQKEALIIQQSKVATAGEMLQNISHQWRQPLSQISTISTGILVQNEHGLLNKDLLKEHMNNINNSAQYLSQTIEDFENFLKPSSTNKKVFNVLDAVKKVLKLTKDAYYYDNINIILIENDIEICQNKNLLVQALLNILNNARDALVDKKDIQEDLYIKIEIKKISNNIFIYVKDNAGGIKEEIIHKIFEPYFTTKHKGKGVGIGLYMTYQIISKQLNGNIYARNEDFIINNTKYKGTCMKIQLPF